MFIRQFRNSDAEAISAIILENLKDINSQHYSDSTITNLIAEFQPEKLIAHAENELIVVADLYDELIGTATINIKEGMFGTVFVKPEYHGKGLGKKLMRSLEELLKESGKTKFELHASVTAVKFYEKIGYHNNGKVQDKYYGESFKMSKEL